MQRVNTEDSKWLSDNDDLFGRRISPAQLNSS